MTEKILNFYNHDGTLKSKSEINTLVDNLYDDLVNESDGDSGHLTYLDEITLSDFQLAEENNNFIQRNLYLTESFTEKEEDEEISLAPQKSIAQRLMEKIIMYNQIDNESKLTEKERQPIKLFINTNGGEITEAFELIDIIESSKTPIITIGTGKIYSAGLLIFLAAETRLAFKHSSYLLHEGSAAYGGDAQKFDSWADFYKNKIREQMKTYILLNTNITAGQYEAIRKDDIWLTAKDAIEYGIVTRYYNEGDFDI